MHCRKVFLVFHVLTLTAICFFPVVAPAAEEVFDAAGDFKFLELQRELRENPNGPRVRENLFAIGEYYFQENNPKLAADYFRRFGPSELKKTEDLVAKAYLTSCATKIGDTASAAILRKELEEALSAHSFFVSFNNTRFWSWKSPLNNRFDFHETVDHLEISLNGRLFYTINLS